MEAQSESGKAHMLTGPVPSSRGWTWTLSAVPRAGAGGRHARGLREHSLPPRSLPSTGNAVSAKAKTLCGFLLVSQTGHWWSSFCFVKVNVVWGAVQKADDIGKEQSVGLPTPCPGHSSCSHGGRVVFETFTRYVWAYEHVHKWDHVCILFCSSPFTNNVFWTPCFICMISCRIGGL